MPTTERPLRAAPGHRPETCCSQGPGCLLETVGALGPIRQLALGTTLDFAQVSAKGFCIAQASSQFPQESSLFSKGFKLLAFARLILTWYFSKNHKVLQKQQADMEQEECFAIAFSIQFITQKCPHGLTPDPIHAAGSARHAHMSHVHGQFGSKGRT